MNNCLKKGLPFQNKLWDVLVRSRFNPVILCADIEKDYLQLCIRENKRDCFRFRWVEATNNDKIQMYRFIRLVFGLIPSSFILEGTWDAHFNNCGQKFREVVEK